MSLDETLDIGEDTGTPVSEDYKVTVQVHRQARKSHHQHHRGEADRGAAGEIPPGPGEKRHRAVIVGGAVGGLQGSASTACLTGLGMVEVLGTSDCHISAYGTKQTSISTPSMS